MRILLLMMLASSISAQSIHLMSYNLRYPNPDDGEHYWPHRRPMVSSVIRFHQADIIGVQEAFRSQLDELSQDLPEHAWTGRCRTDGSAHPSPDNEFSAIFYRKARFEMLDGGTFWLSPTPEKVGSQGWDAALPRIATWAKLKDRDSGMAFFVFNTHFDHKGETARAESAKLILQKIGAITKGEPAVLTGDFNCSPEDLPYAMLTAQGSPLRDAKEQSETPHHGPFPTWTDSFKVSGTGQRIDFIFVSSKWRVLRHANLAENWGGYIPSDHLPVFAELLLH